MYMPQMPYFTPSIEYIIRLLGMIFAFIWYNIYPFHPLKIILALVFIYLLTSISMTLSPSNQDLKNGIVGIIIIVLVMWIITVIKPLEWLGLHRGTPILDIIANMLYFMGGMGVTMTLVSIIVFLPVYVTVKGTG